MTTTGSCSCGAFVLDGGVVPTGDYVHGPAACVRTTPLLPVPSAFVSLAPDVAPPIGQASVERSDLEGNVYRFVVSREMALDLGLVLPTPAEADARAVRAAVAALQRDVARAAPGPALTVDALLAELGWSTEFATHYVHPACSCDPYGEDPSPCSWARELGFTTIGGTL